MGNPNPRQQEHDLVALLRQQDKQAFSDLYDRYSNTLHGVIYQIVRRDEEAASDVLQESFLKIWKNVASYDSSKGTLFTWMLNICRNSAIDALRSKQFRHQGLMTPIDDKTEVGDFENNATKIDHIGVRDVVHELRDDHQKLIDLIYFNGFTQEEAAEELKIPLGTVKSRVRTALQTLRGKFNV